jgi:ABC-type multidrug transport system fused ATPase/permease subunit
MSAAARMLRSCAADEWRALAVAAVSTLAVVVSYLARPLPLALAVDQILDRGAPVELTPADTRMLIALAGLVLAIVLLNTLGSHFADDRLENAAERIVHRLRVATYSQLQRLSLSFHERRRTGNLVTHVTGDVNAVGSLFADSLGGAASAAMVLLGMFAVSLVIDPLVAVTAFAAAPALALVSLRYQPRVRALAKRRRVVAGEIASLSDESLSSVRAVKALGGERFEEERLERKSEELRHISRESTRLEGRMSILVDSLGGLALALVVVVGVLRAAAGAVTIGELIILYTYARRIDRPLRGLSRTVSGASRSLARAERIAEILASDELVEDRAGAFSGGRARGELELRDVEFSYESDRPAIAGVSLRVPAGQRVALVGRSGAGKSTLAALLARLYDPTSGLVLIDGRDARDCSVSWLREQFGLVLQETILFTGTVAENIAYGVEEATPEAVEAAARAAGAHDFIEDLPAGYDTMLGPQAVALSGGQRQRIAIARTLLRDPAVLIVDEPTVGLDAASEAAVLAGLEELMRGRTTIVITHSDRLARAADRAVLVDAGRITADGPPDEVLADDAPEIEFELAGRLGTPLSFEALKDKPGRRRTLRVVGPSDSAIVKLYASDRASTVAARVGALGVGPAEPAVPEVLLCDPARRLVVLSYVPGTPLRQAVLAKDGDACARVGFALGSWHAFWRGRAPDCLTWHTSDREVEIIDACAGALPDAEAAQVRLLARRLRPAWTCSTVVHRDLYEDQILVGRRIGLIDLDDAAAGPPELDIGNLLAHLELRALRDGGGLDGMGGALLRGYARSGAVLDPDLLDRCRRLSLLRLVGVHREPRLLAAAASPRPSAPACSATS